LVSTDGSKDVIYEYKGEKSAICALKSYGNQLFFVIQAVYTPSVTKCSFILYAYT